MEAIGDHRLGDVPLHGNIANDPLPVDNHGDVLTAPGDAGGTSGASNSQQTNAYDNQLAASLTALLGRVVGPGNAAVQVNALLNFNQSQTTTNGLQLNAQGQPDGYTVDLCKSVVRSLELQLNAKLTIEWVAVDTQNRFDAVATGGADLECGSSTVSFERMSKVDFSSFIFMENTGVLVRASSAISGVGDLDGKKIAVIAGTTSRL